MYRYTICCTAEQTKKALELGAPIELKEKLCLTCNIPTAEQMLGWIRAQGFRFKFAENDDECFWQYRIGDWFKAGGCSNPKEATLAAIDAALEYLSNKKHGI